MDAHADENSVSLKHEVFISIAFGHTIHNGVVIWYTNDIAVDVKHTFKNGNAAHHKFKYRVNIVNALRYSVVIKHKVGDGFEVVLKRTDIARCDAISYEVEYQNQISAAIPCCDADAVCDETEAHVRAAIMLQLLLVVVLLLAITSIHIFNSTIRLLAISLRAAVSSVEPC